MHIVCAHGISQQFKGVVGVGRCPVGLFGIGWHERICGITKGGQRGGEKSSVVFCNVVVVVVRVRDINCVFRVHWGVSSHVIVCLCIVRHSLMVN